MKNKLLIRCLTVFAALFALALSMRVATAQDAFGYSSAPTPSNFLNLLDASGNPLPGVSVATELTGDDTSQRISLGFPFFFYETEYTTCFPNTNGLIGFGTGSTSYIPNPIPSGSSPNNFIAAFWTDLFKAAANPAAVPPIPGSKVVYTTQGQAPTRVFIIQYTDMEEFTVATNKITFQVQLYEGSNAIEVQYRGTSGTFGSVATSRNLAVGIENSNGTSGIQVKFGLLKDNYQSLLPTKFTRPVAITVESKYRRPDNTLADASTGLSPGIGISKKPYLSVQRFEAPEFIYLNSAFQELTAIGEVNDPDPAKVARYRLRCLGYAIDGEPVQGVERFFERTIARDMKVIWRWSLEFAAFVEYKDTQGNNLAPSVGNSIGNPIPSVGRAWIAADTQFSASVDLIVGQDPLGMDISGVRFTAKAYQLNVAGPGGTRVDMPVVAVGTTGSRAVTENVIIKDWVRVRWTWAGQVRYRFDAVDTSNMSQPGQAFVRTFPQDNPNTPLDESQVQDTIAFANAPFNFVWIDVGRRAQIGCFYRTLDRCFTLRDFLTAPSGAVSPLGTDISNLTDITLADAQAVPRVARVFAAIPAVGPTEVHFLFHPTVFRAEIPLGQAFDAVNPDLQLVPALCDGAVLRAASQGPAESFSRIGTDVPDGTPVGLPARWDPLGKRLLPVHPGSYLLDWPDATDNTKSYRIELVTGYPADTVALASARELPTGMREGSAPAYVMATTLAPVDSAFPASPEAHYRHHYSPNPDRGPPTKLDRSTTDHWKFQELTFTDRLAKAVANAATAGVPFTAGGTGRCVLLYSYRPNPNEGADGTLTDENLAVRVVRSTPVNPILPDDPLNPLGRRGLELGGGAAANNGAVGVIMRSANALAVDAGSAFALDFWLNTKHLRTDGGPVTVLSTGAGKLEVILNPATLTITANYFGLSTQHPVSMAGAGWSHFVVHVFGESFLGVPVTLLDFYSNGQKAEDGVVTFLLPSGASPGFAATPALTPESLMIGAGADPRSRLQMDQLRLFSLSAGSPTYLKPGDLRTLRERRSSSLRGTPAMLHFDFESPPTTPGSGVYSFPNRGTWVALGVGPKSANDPSGLWTGLWARLDVQEVATRIDSALDDADFNGTGFILNAITNYNAGLYTRAAEIGAWGPLFPVNEKRLFTDAARRLEVGYYENPYRRDKISHPNVAWPYIEAAYDEVIYPTYGPHKDKAIYIASRIGSEGVDQKGRPQQVFDLARYSDLTIYNQPDRALAGFNPNEEHALAASSGRAALKIRNLDEEPLNNPPLAAFALQEDINDTTTASYTSDPWTLVQVNNLITGEPEMAAYRVFKTRSGSGSIAFPRPADSVVASTPGLAYSDAANPDDRFLTLDATKTFNFQYVFDYPVFAGDLLIPPHPLNLVIGNVSLPDERGGNIQIGTVNQRTLWRDVSHHAWVISGGGRFFNQFFYPMRAEFFLPGAAAGAPVAWLPVDPVSKTAAGFVGNNRAGSPSLDDYPRPVKVTYSSQWRSDYPKLKRGETLTYQGGEYFSETPGSNGLPALVAMGAAEVVYDSATPSMVIAAATKVEVGKASARIIRPLDRREASFTVAAMGSAGFTPAAATKVLIVAERWYFKDLPGSLQKRFYFDSLAAKLVFRGRLNDKESGDSNLTAGPDPINVVEPNVMTLDDYGRLRALSTDAGWRTAIDALFKLSQAPNGTAGLAADLASPVFLQGVKPVPSGGISPELKEFWRSDLSGPLTVSDPRLVPLDSFGVGSALVPNSGLLTQNPVGSLYITIAENNRSELVGAPVSLHIIEIIPDRYRGAIKVIEGSDAFSERITLQHNGEFGANTGDLYYEWWIRDAAPLDVVATEVLSNATLKQTDAQGNSLWQEYLPADRIQLADANAKHLGLHTIVFEGRPDVVLADKLVLMRYRHRTEANWKLVPFEFTNPPVTWKPGSILPVTPAPFQWAGAANSPQLQADGSKRYVPQLVMGWVKRILDRINPYEARYTDFFSSESPASYTSQIQIAGAPFAGKVALNPDRNVIENTGLIELYQTVLARARELSIDNSSNPVSTDGINQAILLAATRLSVLYELLAREAYSDAQDPAITVTNDSNLATVASFTHAFQNMESDLLHEELSLLRGTDFLKSYPVYNRIFWNYAKGLGEAAYNVNYNIYDVNTDGFINEDDARRLYPQGHGDAWGHYLSALGMHYTVLQHPNFVWRSRSELYSLMQNVLEVDFLDEKSFARLAAGKARAGRDIIRASYRLHYTQDPDGQWQGYTDGADPARAWGVSEWAHRAGQAAHFDWAVANALLPEKAASATPVTNPENLDFIERSGAEDEIGEVAAGFHEIQTAMDEANTGGNPLGFSSDSIAFDLDTTFIYVGSTSQVGTKAVQGLTHFEQIFERCLVAGKNALQTLNHATNLTNKLRGIADDTESLIVDSLRQDLDYRNRLIEIFGTPYTGQIGFGKAYPEGYLGPDTMLYAYLDKVKIDQIVPPNTSSQTSTVTFSTVNTTGTGMMNDPALVSLYNQVWGNTNGPIKIQSAFETLIGDKFYQFETSRGSLASLTLPYKTASKYGFQAPPAWGQRTSYGKVQRALEEMLQSEIALDQAIAEYIGFLQDWEMKTKRLQSEVALFGKIEGLRTDITITRATINSALVAAETIIGTWQIIGNVVGEVAEAVKEAIPTSIGFSTDVLSPARGAALAVAVAAREPPAVAADILKIVSRIAELLRDELIAKFERDITRAEKLSDFEGLVEELVNLSGNDVPKRDAIGAAILELEMKRHEYFTAQAEGFRLLREREAFNKVLASKTQKNRYQDMIMRLSRNEAMSKYQSAFNCAARYTWLAAKAYDYETSLDPGDPAAATQIFDRIVKERQLGLWTNDNFGESVMLPSVGQGGLADILAQLHANFTALESQLGLNTLQLASEGMSMRAEHFRIGPPLDPAIQEALDLPAAERTAAQVRLLVEPETLEAIARAPASNDRWKDALGASRVEDLWEVPEFRVHCRPFADPSAGPQPGLVIHFGSAIEPGLNFFGRPLAAGDHAYSSSQFATRIATASVVFTDYPISGAAGLAATPRAYLVPVGTDYCRVSTANNPMIRSWNVHDARIPMPFSMNQSQLTAPGFIPLLDGVDGSYGEIRRHGDFRVYHDADLDGEGAFSIDDDNRSTRLIARSIWNSDWILIIPGAGLYADASEGLDRLVDAVSDIQLYFKTYAHNGQ